ncbi:MAG: fatty acid--CoA ligase [Parvibaculaceae bacterium]
MAQTDQHTSPVELDQIRTLADLSRYHARKTPGSIALIFEGRETSYGVLDERSNQIANALLADGLDRGSRVAYIGKNSDRYFELLIAAAKIGAVMLPIGWRLAAAEMAFIIEHSESRIVFHDEHTGPTVGEAIALCAKVPNLIDINNSNAEYFEPWWRQHSSDDPEFEVPPDAVALQIYTSGTTGRPKGVMLSHYNLLEGWRAAGQMDLEWNRWHLNEASLIAMPVSHIGGTGWGILGFLHGAKNLVLREFDPEVILSVIESERISKMFLVPSALQILLRQESVKRVDFTALRYVLYGASPMPLALLRECLQEFGCGFCQHYGMTEASGPVVYLPPEDHDPAGNDRMRAAGIPMPGVDIRIVDDTGQRLPANVVGEIAVRCPTNMKGYWKDEAATRQALDPDGWLRTGDAGYLDQDGYVFIEGRKKEMIISGGENIYPAEVENAIFSHPDVAEVAVLGVPHPKWGEAVAACIVLKPDVEPDADRILDFACSSIASFKVPKIVNFVASLPKNASGKVLKYRLREWFSEPQVQVSGSRKSR